MRYMLFFLLLAIPLFSEIKKIHLLSEIPIEEFSEMTLTLFDIDDVLIYPKDALLQNWRSAWKPEGMRGWTPEEDTIAWMSAKFQILDPLGPELLQLLQDRKIPTIGFTAFALEGKASESVPKWRSQHLRELGLHFRSEEKILFPFSNEFPPSFQEGVLYCGDIYKNDNDNKGKILALYLDALDWIPEQIVLIDDSHKNLLSVQKELNKREIHFFGFHYIPKELDPIDEKIAHLQYMTLIEQKKWLSDQEYSASVKTEQDIF